jgi:enoyl-CoA hydratase
MFKTVELSEKNLVWTLTLKRPEALNALNSELMQELEQALVEMEKKSFQMARALILTGSGEKAFVAGGDIKEMSQLNADSAQTFARQGQNVLRRLENLKIPVIAAVNGFALGGGLEVALACDFIYASQNAKFGLPEVTLGLLPGFGGTVRLSRVIGPAKAKELTMTGNMITAEEAQNLGLVLQVVPQNELLALAQKTAETIASRGPVAVGLAKKSILAAWDLPVDAACENEAKQFGELFHTQDMREGTMAFVEKRKAQFKGE